MTEKMLKKTITIMTIRIQLNLYNGQRVAVGGGSTVFTLMTMIMIMIILKGTSALRAATYL